MLCHAYSILKEMIFNLFSFRKREVDAMAKMDLLGLLFIWSHSLHLEDLFIAVDFFPLLKKIKKLDEN